MVVGKNGFRPVMSSGGHGFQPCRNLPLEFGASAEFGPLGSLFTVHKK